MMVVLIPRVKWEIMLKLGLLEAILDDYMYELRVLVHQSVEHLYAISERMVFLAWLAWSAMPSRPLHAVHKIRRVVDQTGLYATCTVLHAMTLLMFSRTTSLTIAAMFGHPTGSQLGRGRLVGEPCFIPMNGSTAGLLMLVLCQLRHRAPELDERDLSANFMAL
jgi:hypothetical protein